MTISADLHILWQLARGRRRGGTHQDQLESFYAGQADHYDRFRERLLHGRSELLADLPLAPGERLVDLGGGTGRNVEFIGPRLAEMTAVDVVDLCGPLLEVADRRAKAQGWTNVRTHRADACTWQPALPADVVLCSYSLTMIPDWRAALTNALAMLRPGGRLAVVDFTIAADAPALGRRRQSWLARRGWQRWFAHDGVNLNHAHVEWLLAHTRCQSLVETSGPVPFLPGLRAPYYRYIGVK